MISDATRNNAMQFVDMLEMYTSGITTSGQLGYLSTPVQLQDK